MLRELPYKMSADLLPSPSSRIEDFFDMMVRREKLDDAELLIRDYVESLAPKLETGEYNHAFYSAAIKEIALPMYRKIHADDSGEPYVAGRQEIRGMYDQARLLMGVLLEQRNLQYVRATNDFFPDQAKLRGDLSELTVFTLATRSLKGFGDDYSIIPSPFGGNHGGFDAEDTRKGYDFVVHDRDTDELTLLQVKTNKTSKEYQPHIAMFVVNDFASHLGMELLELQELIANDRSGRSPKLKDASRAMRLYLRDLDRHYDRAA